MSKKNIFLFLFTVLMLAVAIQPAEAKRKSKAPVETRAKREFRGVWLQTAFQERYMRMQPAEAQAYLTRLVDSLAATGFNAVLFQVRPEGDAFYKSELEPWSRFLTGKQGQAPVPAWDPMQHMIDLCHQHHMEFHAWINPYRMSASKNQVLPQGHLYYQHPNWFVRYDGKLYLNPGMPECRAYVRSVVKDIVSRYDIDALHIDDYFYPYPVKGQTFGDRATFEAYAPQMKLDCNKPEDWDNFRRQSVNILIRSLHDDIRSLKPWVRFGVSPFGIYRNQKSWAEGSATNGTQCYDDLYADVLLWAEQGWIDYIIPQLYWEIGHSAADYATLVGWWSQHIPAQCHLYIGQSIERSLDETDAKRKAKCDLRTKHRHFAQKHALASAQSNVLGNCYWYGYQVDEDQYRVRHYLRDTVFAKRIVLPPAFVHIDKKAPEAIDNLKFKKTEQGLQLVWEQPKTNDPLQLPQYYCIYRYRKGEKIDVERSCEHLLARTRELFYTDASISASGKYTYVVTAIDPCNNESAPTRKTVKIKLK
ncbi:MAG: family 10 glycosylhydrolase [Bacteroidales bacterium]|nr:family 10 glycosylhydrolase [Bacteroidales bacterium]